ncbi:hypothetical protein [Yoonia sediminilitoris]|uniref:Uncharacterized protein n=1 Tax=Yoonia sediminilitoris TaxID=1286148 RepID=A0A2T6KBZ4_9RHOB|nr:hypothetical protein [Yoonia sediminilitoris]PUB12427.1 hypothetical protein C8N45_11066 [Yoonia sediminilitoris]RCW93121.1 hypothetical protein DFP92_11066 [Yoonia sediminilitoris]
MFGSVVLEIFLGLAFLFLTLSLVVTTAQELLAGLFGMRAANLIKGVRNLLHDGDGRQNERPLTEEVFNHPALMALYKGRARSWLSGLVGNGPSYVPNSAFSVALLDTLRRRNSTGTVAPISLEELFGRAPDIVEGLPPGPLRDALTLLVGHGGETERSLHRRAAEAEKKLSEWFDASMNRASGWYKRKSQAIGLVLGAALVLVVDANALDFIADLRTNATLREALSESAGNAVSATSDQGMELLLAQLDQFPLGWDAGETIADRFADSSVALRSVAGWLMTVLAISLGAAFWFDLTKKALTLRASGPKPGETIS